MRVYELGGWTWSMGEKPTERNIWNIYGSDTGIEAGIHRFESHRIKPGVFSFNDIPSFRKEGWTIENPDYFYEIQGINELILKQPNIASEVVEEI